jgi:NAD/NADP transhydrogenase beta subunit
MSMNLVTLLYLLASVCFIQALKGLSHPTTARRGNAFGMTGMAIAAVTTLALIYKLKSELKCFIKTHFCNYCFHQNLRSFIIQFFHQLFYKCIFLRA